MEDKRTLLAFLIIGLILILLPYYYEWAGLTSSPPPETEQLSPSEKQSSPSEGRTDLEPKEKPEGKAAGPLEIDSKEKGDEEALMPSFQKEGFVPREITVRTPLQKLVFSTAGGVLISCQLSDYSRMDGRQVELVPDGGRELRIFLKKRSSDAEQDLENVEFIPTMAQNELIVSKGEQRTLRLVAELKEGQRIERNMTFYGDQYGFDLEVAYKGFDEDARLFLVWNKGIAFAEKEPEIDLRAAQVYAYLNRELTKIQVKDEEETWNDKGLLQWAGVRNKYFLSALAPRGDGRYWVLLRGRGQGKAVMPDYTYEVGTRLDRSGTWKTLVYLGPLDYEELAQYQLELEQAIDLGWPVVRQISWLLLVIFKATHRIIPNYGWIIVLFAVVIKLLVYPLTHKTYESTAKMQALQPKIAALREKYKNDQQRLSKETMKLYKEEGVNPLGGCLPLLLQMPIFFALYRIFGNTIELRQAPFILWITDLSLPDELIVAGFSLHVLPLLMAVSMLIQQKMTMKDPKQAFMVYLMPVMMIFIFWKMSSGLVLYWTIFNLLTIGQQVLINRFKEGQPAPAPVRR